MDWKGQQTTYETLVVIWIFKMLLCRSMMPRCVKQLLNRLESVLNIRVTAGDPTQWASARFQALQEELAMCSCLDFTLCLNFLSCKMVRKIIPTSPNSCDVDVTCYVDIIQRASIESFGQAFWKGCGDSHPRRLSQEVGCHGSISPMGAPRLARPRRFEGPAPGFRPRLPSLLTPGFQPIHDPCGPCHGHDDFRIS